MTTAPERQAPVVDLPAESPRLEEAQGQEEQRHPLDRDRQRPGDAGQPRLPGRGERKRTEHEGHHPRVVVPPAGEVDGEERVPADEGRREGGSAESPRGEEDERHHRDRGKAR